MHALGELFGPIVYHAALGLALAAAVWLAGAGILQLGRRLLGRPFEPRDLLVAYPFGLLAVVVVAFVALESAIAGVVALAAFAVACWYGWRGRRQFGDAWAAASMAALRAAPFAFGYALVCGSLLHGATHDLDSHALGDNAIWVSETNSVAHDPVRIPDLATLGYALPRLETSAPYLFAALNRVVPLDFYLAGTSMLTAFLVVSLAAGIGILLRSRRDAARPSLLTAAALALIALASIGYPSWIPESPSVALALPLAFAAYWLLSEKAPVVAALVVSSALAVCIALTKTLAAPVVLAVVAIALSRHRITRPSKRQLAAAILVGAAGIALAVAFASSSSTWLVHLVHARFLPYDTVRKARELTHIRRFETLSPVAQLVGIVLLTAFLVRRRRWTLLAVGAAGLAPYWLLYGQNFQIAFYVALLLVALDELGRGDIRTTSPLLLTAGIALGLGAWWYDPAQSRGSFVMSLVPAAGIFTAIWARHLREVGVITVVCAAGAALGLAGQVRLGVLVVAGAAALWAWAVASPTTTRRRAVAVTLVAVAFAGAAAELVRAQRNHTANFGTYDETVYPHEDYAVWKEVAKRTGRDALVFTSQTGPVIDTFQGWNYYPGIAGRQVYLAGWTNSPLVNDHAALVHRLQLNQAVLIGSRFPSSVPGAGAFRHFFAVIRTSERHPGTFHLLYENRLYALYELPTAQ